MVLFFDLDGTLLLGGQISERCHKALEMARDAGHTLVINTGRAPAFVPEKVFNDPVFDGHICGSTYVDFKGKVLSYDSLSKDLLARVYDFSIKNGLQVVYEGAKENFISCAQGLNYTDAALMFSREELPAIVKITFACDPKKVPADAFEGLRVVHFKSYAEGIKQGYDKAYGMKLILEELGLSREDAVAFGDSENDIDMLKFAGKGVAMKNAPESFDDFCVYRAEEQDGVPEGLLALGLCE